MSDLWTYNRGMPDRSDLFRFTHLIRWSGDPDETMARGAGKRDPLHWRKTDPIEVWADRLLELMSDGQARTFNCMCVELTGTNASVWFESAIDQALWFLVKVERLMWACEEGCVFFIASAATTGDQP